MKKIICCLSILLIITSCSTYRVSNVGANTPSKNGKHYYLPKTVFDVIITYEETIPKVSSYNTTPAVPGSPYYTTIASIDGPIDVIDNPAKSYKITSVDISEITIPDESQLYYIEFLRTNALFLNKKYVFENTSQGILSSGLTESEDYTTDFIASSVSALGGAASKIFLGGAAAGSGAGAASELTWLVARLNLIRLSKMNLLSGQYDGNSYQAYSDLMKELKEQEETLEKIIGGTTVTKIRKEVVRIDPVVGSATVAKFSAASGINLAGNPIDITITKLFNHTSKISTITTAKQGAIKDRNEGIYFKEPAVYDVVVKYNTDILKTQIINLPQFGATSFLPSKVGTAKNSIAFSIDPKTGVLLKMDASGSGPSIDALKAVNSSLAELPNQLKKEKKGDFEEIEKKIKDMELKIKEKTLQQQLDSLYKTNNQN